MRTIARALGAIALIAAPAIGGEAGAKAIPPAVERFASTEATEVPDFQKHVLPAMGRLGCNGRACHGSFQGQGGFRLSLFGYDFKSDYDALLAEGSGRVDRGDAGASKILAKPTLAMPHKGGKRLVEDSWEYNLLHRWIEGGAKATEAPAHLDSLEVSPREIVFAKLGETSQLKVTARWSDGTTEDVTCMTRFRSNDDAIAEIAESGLVTAKGKGDTHVVAFYDNGVAPTQVILPVSEQSGDRYPALAGKTKVDELILAKLRKLGVLPSGQADDATFLRRVSLDIAGTLPAPQEVQAFLKDQSPDKRAKKIDELLASPAYAANWTTLLCDLTGASTRNLQNVTAPEAMAEDWYRWIEKRVRENTPYDKLVEGIVVARSRQAGESSEGYYKRMSSYYSGKDRDSRAFAESESMPYYWFRRNLRTPDEKALGFSYAFLGIRLECAQCHKHPFDQWTQGDFQQFTEFFKPVNYVQGPDFRKATEALFKEKGIEPKNGGEARRALQELLKEGTVVPWQEIRVAGARPRGKNQGQAKVQGKNRVLTPKLLGGDEVALAGYDDPRSPLMEWMRDPENPYFARAWVNRVWAHYFGAGIVNPADDMNLANPPSNEALLDYLVRGFIESGFDMKWLHREVANSDAYQRDWKTNETNALDERNYSHALIRRMPAEVLLDAITLATASSGDLKKAATEIEGRRIGPLGNTARIRAAYAGQVFGQSTRETNCDCSRSNEPNLLQAIFLQNDERDLLPVIERRGGWVAELAGASYQPVAEPGPVRVNAKGKEKEAKGGNPRAAMMNAGGKEMRRLVEQLKELRKAGRKPEARALAARIKALRDAIVAKAGAAPGDKPGMAGPGGKAAAGNQPELSARAVVRQAYLRVLGRPPAAEEAKEAETYLRDAGNVQDGARDLLWALLNTKEFITNH